jgi:hypothetical protein
MFYKEKSTLPYSLIDNHIHGSFGINFNNATYEQIKFVLAELYKVMPNLNYTFFGDTKNVPYGTKTSEEIFSYTKKILDFFISQDIKTVVFACNTTSAVAYDKLKDYFKK